MCVLNTPLQFSQVPLRQRLLASLNKRFSFLPEVGRGKINGGESGIRTRGTVLPVRRFSKPFLSATQASLQGFGCVRNITVPVKMSSLFLKLIEKNILHSEFKKTSLSPRYKTLPAGKSVFNKTLPFSAQQEITFNGGTRISFFFGFCPSRRLRSISVLIRAISLKS